MGEKYKFEIIDNATNLIVDRFEVEANSIKKAKKEAREYIRTQSESGDSKFSIKLEESQPEFDE